MALDPEVREALEGLSSAMNRVREVYKSPAWESVRASSEAQRLNIGEVMMNMAVVLSHISDDLAQDIAARRD